MAFEDPPVAADLGFVPPLEFDGFRIVRQLGRGGMGQVYLGRDDVLDRPVALKFLSAADPKTGAAERFLVEARAIARLGHPNVVGIYRVGEVFGRPYLAYELIAGKSLEELPKPVTWQRALDLALGVARGLSAAHRRDVLHRDVKPANVMLADSGEVKLIDFGLAKLLDGKDPRNPRGSGVAKIFADAVLGTTLEAAATRDPAETMVLQDADASLTATGALLGTPLYMAPELWRGEAATAQTDVYAVGLVIYELLAGRLPHEGLRPAELAAAVQSREPPEIRTLCPTVPQALADVVHRCLRLSRKERFASADDLSDALEAIRALYQPFAAELPAPLTGTDEAAEIAASFARIAPRADAFATRMYERLFASGPHLRPLFPADMTALRRKLFGALTVIVDNLRRPERLLPLLEDLGRRHARYGVEPEHFDLLGAALIGAASDFDEGFRAATKAAWTAAFALIAQAMKRGLAHERQAPVAAPDHDGGRPTGPAGAPEAELQTRYARSGDVAIAYQILGHGPVDLILTAGWLTHLEIAWQWPPLARWIRALASVGRLIVLDARGVGLSDPLGSGVLLEDRVADLRAVLDAAGAERAALIGLGDAAAACALFAATHPERARALILYGGNARTTSGDDYPHGLTPDQHDEIRALVRASWGEPLFVDTMAPSLAEDPAFRSFWARSLRSAASPGAAIAHLRAAASIDVRAILPSIHVPALVLHREGDARVPIEAGRFLAQHIPGARMVEMAGADHLPFAGDGGAIVDEVRRFVGQATRRADSTRMLAAVVSLAERGAATPPADAPPLTLRGGDRPLALLCEREIARFRGIDLGGVGHVPGEGRAAAMFDGPARAVRFARAMIGLARMLGIDLAAGISFAACYVGDAEVAGPAVHLARAAAASAAAGEILVTDHVRALLGGAMRLEARGSLAGDEAGESPGLWAVLPDASG